MTLPKKLTLRHYLFLLAVTLLLFITLLTTRPEKQKGLRPALVPAVAVVAVAKRDVYPTLKLSGRLQPKLSTTLSAEVAGRVVERAVEPGQVVEKGDLLLRLEEGDYLDALTRAEAQLAQERAAIERDRRLLKLAQQNRELQTAEVARLDRLGSESLTSVSRRDEARQRLIQLEAEEARLDYSVATAVSRLSLRQAEQARAERDLARCRVTAPFDGTVNRVEAELGDRIAVNKSLLSLMALDELDFYAELPGDAQTELTLGQTLVIYVNSNAHEGRLVSLQREPDRKTHTLALRLRLNGEGLMPGAMAETSLPLRHLESALLIPVSALLREDGKAYLFIEQQGRLSRREVTTGMRDGEGIVVLSGVKAGERIVARDVAALSDGQQVKVLPQNARE